MLDIDFSTPPWLINSYHVIGTASLFLNSLGVYLLMYQSNKLDKIRYYMLIYQISCFMADVHLTFLMQAVPLYPMFSGFTVGALSEWFDVSLHYNVVYILFVILIELEFLILCFEKKHRAIARTLNTHVLPDWFLRFCYFTCLVCPFAIAAWFHSLQLPKKEQWDVIRKDWPQYLEDFEKLDHFDIYVKTWWFILLLITTIAGGVTLMSFFLLFILDIFRMMINLKLKISPVRYQKHREAIQNLMVQFATSSFCLLPPCCLVIIVMLELDKAQLLTELCILWFAAHSSTNMLCLLIFFAPYRNYLLKQLRLRRNPIAVLINGGKSSNVVQPSTVLREQRSVLSFAEVS